MVFIFTRDKSETSSKLSNSQSYTGYTADLQHNTPSAPPYTPQIIVCKTAFLHRVNGIQALKQLLYT